MKKGRFSEEQIMKALHEWEAGAKPGELCRRLGVTETTLYHWKRKYGGLEVNAAPPPRTRRRESPAQTARRRSGAQSAGCEGPTGKKW